MPPARLYPTVQWSEYSVTFAESADGTDSSQSPYACLVFCFEGGALLLANIPDRGWSVPGGRSEAGETAEETALREVREEVGATVEQLISLGVYTLQRADGPDRTVCTYAARVTDRSEIPEHSESLGVRLCERTDLPNVYYRWDPLIEAVCECAFKRAQLLGWA